MISIHALLAESDCRYSACCVGLLYFYPRSPCGERLNEIPDQRKIDQFLSTLSLRRATYMILPRYSNVRYFYPRSPCGERRVHYDNYNLHCVISIHALLAESDKPGERHASSRQEFLSTLSLRRATPAITRYDKNNVFLSTLSLRRATKARGKRVNRNIAFLSTLSLRRATH